MTKERVFTSCVMFDFVRNYFVLHSPLNEQIVKQSRPLGLDMAWLATQPAPGLLLRASHAQSRLLTDVIVQRHRWSVCESCGLCG